MNDKDKHYYAFISYKSEDREIAIQIHQFLEEFNFSQLKITCECNLPEFIRPVFLDDEEINGGLLQEILRDSLDSSEWLILLCSKRSSKSEYVDKEVRRFIETGKTKRIIPYIIDGTPRSKDPSEECFPKALLDLSNKDEIVAFNPEKYSGKQTEALVRIIEHMFGLENHELWDRHLNREKEERKRLKNASDRLFRVSAMAAIHKATPLLEIGDNLLAAKIAFHLLTVKYDENPLFIPEAERLLRSSIYSSFYNQPLSLINFRHHANDYAFHTKFSNDNKYLFYWTDEEAGLIDLKSLKKIHIFKNIYYQIHSVTFSHNNLSIVVTTEVGIHYYDIICDKEIFKKPFKVLNDIQIAERAFFNEDDTLLIVSSFNNLLYYDLASLNEIKRIYIGVCKDIVVCNNYIYLTRKLKDNDPETNNECLELLRVNINSGIIDWRHESTMIKFSDSHEKLVFLDDDGYHIVDLKTSRVVNFDEEFCEEFDLSLSERGNLVVYAWPGRTYIQWFDTEAISFIDKECKVFLSNGSDDCIIRFINQNNENDYRFISKPLNFMNEITSESGMTVGEADECYRLISFTSCGNPVFINNNNLCSVYDANTGKLRKEIANVKQIIFSPDDRYVITQGEEYNLQLFDSEFSIKNFYPNKVSASILFNSEFGQISCEKIYENHRVKYAVLKNELTRQKYTIHYDDSISHCIEALSGNEQYIAFRDIQGISILDISSFSVFPCVKGITNTQTYYCVRFSEDNEWLLIDHQIYINIFDKKGLVTRIDAEGDLYFRSVSAYNGIIAISDREKTLILRWNNSDLQLLNRIEISTSTLILIPNDDNLILIDDGQILNYVTGEIRILDDHPKDLSIYDRRYTFDLNRNLIAGLFTDRDGAEVLVIWDMLSGYITVRQELEPHTGCNFKFENNGIIVGNLFVPYPSLANLIMEIKGYPYSFEMTEIEKKDYYIAF